MIFGLIFDDQQDTKDVCDRPVNLNTLKSCCREEKNLFFRVKDVKAMV